MNYLPYLITVTSSAITLIIFYFHSIYKTKYSKLKTTLHSIRKLIDSLDDALQDDKITKEEMQNLIQIAKKLLEEIENE